MTTTATNPTKIAEGREAEIYAWEPGTVLRLLRNAGGRPRLEREAAAMEAARACAVPVPAVRGFAALLGRDGLIMDRIDGPDLLSDIGKRPWTVMGAGRLTGELHAELHEVMAPVTLPALRAESRRRIETLPLPAHLATFALRQLDALPDGDRLCHGDFHPGNVIYTAKGPMVIDWPNVTRGDPDGDYARTLLMLRLGEPPPGSPFVIRYFIGVARGLFLSSYRRAYLARRTPDAAAVARWEIVRVADRIADGIEGERGKLMRILEERYQTATARS